MLRRTPEAGGFWRGVTGALEYGESFEEAARRELFEETGFIPNELVRIDYSYTFPMEDQWQRKYSPDVREIVEHVFLAFLNAGASEPKSDPREHDRWAWCPFEEALKKLRWPGNIEALKRCERIVRAKFAQTDER